MAKRNQAAFLPVRVQLGLYAVLLMAGTGVFTLVDGAAVERKPYAPAVVDQLLSDLKKTLPPGTTSVGYTGDLNLAVNPSSYYLFQYALAPVLVLSDTHHRYVVGSFVHPEQAPAMGAAQGLIVEHDFGNGIVLFRGR